MKKIDKKTNDTEVCVGYIVVTDYGDISSILDNEKDILEYLKTIEDQFSEHEIQIYKLVPSEFKIKKTLILT